MTDAARTGTPPVLNDPFARLEGPLAGTTRMRLRVVRNEPLTPAMQQVVLSAPELAGFAYQPGQDVMLMVGVDGDRPVRRRYTIRAADPAQCLLTLGIVRHENGPGERWVRTARPGDEIEGIAPRGKIFPSDNEFCRQALFSKEGFRRCNDSVPPCPDVFRQLRRFDIHRLGRARRSLLKGVIATAVEPIGRNPLRFRRRHSQG